MKKSLLVPFLCLMTSSAFSQTMCFNKERFPKTENRVNCLMIRNNCGGENLNANSNCLSAIGKAKFDGFSNATIEEAILEGREAEKERLEEARKAKVEREANIKFGTQILGDLNI